MGRPYGTKSVMRTAEEKEKIVLEYLNGNEGYSKILIKYNISESTFRKWKEAYRKDGIEGLISKTGKCTKREIMGRPKKVSSRVEELERENIKLKIEIERLKKGYYVKGGGAKKEYVSINNRSIESSKN